MRVAFVQTAPKLGETWRNLEEAYGLIERVREADLIVLPELFHCGYAVRDRGEAVALAVAPEEGSKPLAMCLGATRQFVTTIVGGFLEKDESGKLFNSAWLIGPGGVHACYRKVHLFDHEWDIFEPGSEPSPVVEVAGARVGMQVCFDWAFPEDWGRLAWGEGEGGSGGAQVIAHPANLVLPDACPLAVRARALENRVFVVTAGRVGTDQGPKGEIEFVGGSRIVAPDGSVLAAGPDDEPGCDMVTINPSWADDKYLTPRDHILRERFGEPEGHDEESGA